MLLVIEAIVCFGPALLVLSLAAFLVPVQFVALNSEAMIAEGPLLVLTSMVAGAIGVGTLLYVLTKLLRGESVARPLPVLVAVLVAFLPLCRLAWDSTPGWRILYALPILASVHILYLSWPLMLRPGERVLRARDGNDFARIALLAVVAASVFIRPDWGLSEDQLRERRAAWMGSMLHSYAFELWPAGYVPVKALDRPHRVEVRNGKVIAATHLIEGPTVSPEMAWTMEEIFDQLLKAHSQGSRVRVRFDKRCGYVQRAFVETKDHEWDWSIEVRGFQPLTEDSATK